MKTYRKRFLQKAVGFVLLGATLSMTGYTVANAMYLAPHPIVVHRGGIYGYGPTYYPYFYGLPERVVPVAAVPVPVPQHRCGLGLGY